MARKPRSALPLLRFDDLPLFPTDEQIAEACVGSDPERIRQWIIGAPGLEACGFPKKVPLYGARYAPAVKRFYDDEFMPYRAPEQDEAHPQRRPATPRKRFGPSN